MLVLGLIVLGFSPGCDLGAVCSTTRGAPASVTVTLALNLQSAQALTVVEESNEHGIAIVRAEHFGTGLVPIEQRIAVIHGGRGGGLQVVALDGVIAAEATGSAVAVVLPEAAVDAVAYGAPVFDVDVPQE